MELRGRQGRRRAPVTENGVQFAKRVGIVAGAVLAVITLGNSIGGFAMRTVILPEIERIMVEERTSRVRADSLLSVSIRSLSRDRINILTMMEERTQSERIRTLRLLRERLRSEE